VARKLIERLPGNGHVVADITPIYHSAAFDPETVRIMAQAFDQCRKAIPDTPLRAATEEAVAKLIIELVRRGVRDPIELCKEAQRELGISH
jgi:hypothetical protein